jgi:alkylation response protein AidB-like acyl-CoA dehydrogenase
MNLPHAIQERKARARRFVDEQLIPLEVATDLAGGALRAETRHQLHGAMLAAELNGMTMPVELGGQGLSNLAQVAVWEELGRATNGLWAVVFAPAVCMKYASPAQIERYVRPGCRGERRAAYAITEAGAGSDPSRLETRAVLEGGAWRISGEKWHVTSFNVADYLVVQADTERGITLFFVEKDAPGLELIDTPAYMHNYIIEHPRIRLRDVRVPADAVLGEVGQGLDLSKAWFRHERLLIAARCCGAAARLIEAATAFAHEREQFGAPIAQYQAIQFMLADSATELWAARLMAYAAAEAEDAISDAESLKVAHVKASMAKLYASEMAGRVADRALQIFGGRGYMRECVAERFYRDLRVDRIWEGTSEIQRLIIAQGLYRRGLDSLI